MAEYTVDGLAELSSPAANDEIGIWDVSAGQYLKIRRDTLIGGTVTGGGTIATGGYTLTAPATGTAALREVDNAFSVGQTIGPLGVGVTTKNGISRPQIGVLKLQVPEYFLITGPGSLGITGFSWGFMMAIVEIPSLGLATGLIAWDGNNATILAGSSWFSPTINTANRINCYVSGGAAVLQNLFSVAVNGRLLLVAP